MQFYWQTYADLNYSDIAIDDIEITSGECNVTYPILSTKGKFFPGNFYCTVHNLHKKNYYFYLRQNR